MRAVHVFFTVVLVVAVSIAVTGSIPDLGAGERHGKRRQHVRPHRGTPPPVEGDPAEVTIGERLFLEMRFAQFFAAHPGGDVNAPLPAGDPVLDTTATPAGSLPGPFAGASMNCRACHLVDEHGSTPGAGNRTYADFARRSPLPEREDGLTVTPRNSPPLVNATLDRKNFLLHFDGEFATLEDLVRETLLGRNFGWLPNERRQALRHIAKVIRHDDGTGELAQEFGGAYRVVLKGTDPSIVPELRLPKRFRIDVRRATDRQILDAVARLVGAYVESLIFIQDEAGEFDGSPYDVFLRKNGLPRAPDRDESDREYTERLAALIERLGQPQWVGAGDGSFALHDQAFAFGPTELAGLKTFLRGPRHLPLRSQDLTSGGIGNCAACHPAPRFTDFEFHNTGAAQNEYDAIHGAGAFFALFIPDLRTRNRSPETWLPPSPAHPQARGPFLSVPAADRPGETDLGLWNVFANPAHPRPQARLRRILCDDDDRCRRAALLEEAIARFKTPGLRDLGHSGPYLHTGQADTLEQVVGLYGRFAALARAGTMRNPAPQLAGIALVPDDVRALAAFLRALNEDYE